MSLICVFDSSYHIENDNNLKDELQKLLYCKHIKNVIVDYAPAESSESSVTRETSDNPIQEVSTSEMKNTMYIFPSVINEVEEVEKIQEYLNGQDENDPKTPIMLFIGSSIKSLLDLFNRFDIAITKKQLNILCNTNDLSNLVKLLQTMYFGNQGYVKEIICEQCQDSGYSGLLEKILKQKYNKFLRLPGKEAHSKNSSNSTIFYEDAQQLGVAGERETVSSQPSASFDILIKNPADEETEPQQGTVIIPDLSDGNPKFANYLIDFFLIEADKKPDFKGMETGEMPPKQELHEQAYKLFAKYGVKEIENAKHNTIMELEEQMNSELKHLKDWENKQKELDKLYNSTSLYKEVYKLFKYLSTIKIEEEWNEAFSEYIKTNKYNKEECKADVIGLKYSEFFNKKEIDKYTKINRDDTQNTIENRKKQLNCMSGKSRGLEFMAIFLNYELQKNWININLGKHKTHIERLDVQIRSLKGKQMPKKMGDVFVHQQNMLNEARKNKITEPIINQSFSSYFNTAQPLLPTAEGLRKNLADNIHHRVRGKLLDTSTTLRKATNQIQAIEAKINKLTEKGKECHRDKTTSHHWKYTIKRDKEYREACKLQDRLNELNKYKPSPPSRNPLELAGFI